MPADCGSALVHCSQMLRIRFRERKYVNDNSIRNYFCPGRGLRSDCTTDGGCGRRILEHEAVRRAVGSGKHRLLKMELIDATPVADKPSWPHPPGQFRATIHDYASTRTFVVEDSINAVDRLTVSETAEQPNATAEEFQEAVEMLHANSPFAEGLHNGQLVAYRPMPPLIDVQEPTGRTKRVVAVGLFSKEQRTPVEILGGELASNILHRFDERAPPGTYYRR